MELVERACHELRGPLTAARLAVHLAARVSPQRAARPARRRSTSSWAARGLALADLSAARQRRARTQTASRRSTLGRCSRTSPRPWRAAACGARASACGCERLPGRVLLRGDRDCASRRRSRTCSRTRSSTATARCWLRARAGVHSVRVEVLDEGPGLPAPVAVLVRRPRGGRRIARTRPRDRRRRGRPPRRAAAGGAERAGRPPRAGAADRPASEGMTPPPPRAAAARARALLGGACGEQRAATRGRARAGARPWHAGARHARCRSQRARRSRLPVLRLRALPRRFAPPDASPARAARRRRRGRRAAAPVRYVTAAMLRMPGDPADAAGGPRRARRGGRRARRPGRGRARRRASTCSSRASATATRAGRDGARAGGRRGARRRARSVARPERTSTAARVRRLAARERARRRLSRGRAELSRATCDCLSAHRAIASTAVPGWWSTSGCADQSARLALKESGAIGRSKASACPDACSSLRSSRSSWPSCPRRSGCRRQPASAARPCERHRRRSPRCPRSRRCSR